MAKQPPINKDLRQALRRVQILETQLWDGKLEPVATRKALERVSKGQSEVTPTSPKKPRRPRKPVYDLWTPVEAYAEKIAARRDERSWLLSDGLIEQFAQALVPHAGRLLPISVNTWLGGTLEYNVSELWAWIADEQIKAGHNRAYLWPEFKFDSKHLDFVEELSSPKELMLQPISLDLATYKGSSPQSVVRDERPEYLAGLDVFTLLALNPQVVPKMGKEVPHLWVPAFRANWPGRRDWQGVPVVCWHAGYRLLEASISWTGYAGPDVAVAVRRELQR